MSFPKPVIVTLAALALAMTTTTLAAELKVGDAFPDLRQFGLVGELPREFKGKIVLVDFWASWCAPCKLSFPVLNDLSARFGARGLVVVGISVDESKAAMQEFLKQTAPRFTVVHDAGQKLVQRVDVASMPTSFIIDGNGKVRFIHSGFHGDKTRDEYAREIESLLPTQAAK
jgi:thiol-disulfide isomerase/thioredoxin